MLDRLTDNEQRALMELLIYLAKVDGVVADIEREVLMDYADIVDVDLSTLEGDLTPEELIPQFESRGSCVIVLQELLRLSHLDGRFAAGERAAIADVAGRMGVSRELLQQIDNWVIEGLNWVARGQELVEIAEENGCG